MREGFLTPQLQLIIDECFYCRRQSSLAVSGCERRAARPAASPATRPQVRDVSSCPSPHGHRGPLWGEAGVSVSCEAAHRPWHKEGDTMVVVSQIARGLQALLGVAQLGPSNGASSHAQERLLGSPSTPMVSSTWRPTLSSHAMSPRSLCPGVVAWSLILAHQLGSAEAIVPTRAPLAPVAASQEGFGVADGIRHTSAQVLVLWCVSTGSLAGWHGVRWCCSPSSWQQVRTLLHGWHGWAGGVGGAFSPQHSFRIP